MVAWNKKGGKAKLNFGVKKKKSIKATYCGQKLTGVTGSILSGNHVSA